MMLSRERLLDAQHRNKYKLDLWRDRLYITGKRIFSIADCLATRNSLRDERDDLELMRHDYNEMFPEEIIQISESGHYE